MTTAYRAFLESKVRVARSFGEPITADQVHPICKPHQRDIIRWAVEGGRRAIFANFGLGKTLMQLEAMRLTIGRAGGTALIVAPLGVRQEFIGDAREKLGFELPFVRTTAEIGYEGLYLTNYESVREGKIDVSTLTAVSLDEAAVLRGFGGTKTFREFMRVFDGTPYRFVATATPSPNQYIEIISYAAFLGIMDVGEAKTRFFKRDSEKADHLTIYPHKEEEFWLWVNTWAVFLQRPSDLGYSDEGYELPPLEVRWHSVSSGLLEAGEEWDGQQKLLRDDAVGIQQASIIRRTSLNSRVQKVVELALLQRILPQTLSEEQGAILGSEPSAVLGQQGKVQSQKQGMEAGQSREIQSSDGSTFGEEPREDQRAQREVVSGQQGSGKRNGKKTAAAALRSDRGTVQGNGARPERAVSDLPQDSQDTSGGSLPQNEQGPGHSLSDLQLGTRAPVGEPGSSAESSGLSDQIVIWCDLNDEQQGIEQALRAEGISVSSLYGSQDVDEREVLLEEWRSGQTAVFLSKPTMYGAGVNLQRSHTMIFAGVSFKFADFVQAVHRVHRFLQEHPVTIHVIHAEADAPIVKTLLAKWARHNAQMERMSELIRRYGLTNLHHHDTLKRSIGVTRREESGELFRVVNNDCVDETERMGSSTLDLILTSIPFGTQYEYTPSYNDFGHSDDDAEFFRQMDFLTPELLRVLKPGRMACIHVKDRIRPGGLEGLGFQTVSPFHAECILHYRRHGFAYMGMITVVTDVVRENNQTYRLGWSEQCKDGSRMSVGMPEYVLLFRKPPTDSSNGYADERVIKSKDMYTRARWQIDAHAFWRSNGNRLLEPADLVGLPANEIFKAFRAFASSTVYDYERHVAIGEGLEDARRLPPGFMLLPPPSTHPDVWTDVTRMRTLNGAQHAKGKEMHLCPIQLDLVERLIHRYTNEGEWVYDPFSGLGTVPMVAVQLGRRGIGVELNAGYFADSVMYLRAAEEKLRTPTLFDLTPEAA